MTHYLCFVQYPSKVTPYHKLEEVQIRKAAQRLKLPLTHRSCHALKHPQHIDSARLRIRRRPTTRNFYFLVVGTWIFFDIRKSFLVSLIQKTCKIIESRYRDWCAVVYRDYRNSVWQPAESRNGLEDNFFGPEVWISTSAANSRILRDALPLITLHQTILSKDSDLGLPFRFPSNCGKHAIYKFALTSSKSSLNRHHFALAFWCLCSTPSAGLSLSLLRTFRGASEEKRKRGTRREGGRESRAINTDCCKKSVRFE